MQIFQSLTTTNQALILLAGFIIGMAKAGLKGIELLNVTIMALVFGSKQSTGIVLPLLCLGDILAVIYYKRHVNWPLFWKLIIWMAIGIVIGVFIGQNLGEGIFKKLFASIIFATLFLMIWLEYRKTLISATPKIFAPIIGLLAGATTMLGNLAGPLANIYFMAQKVSKNDFIGTAAWVFLVINLYKIPFQIFYWKNMNNSTLGLDLVLIPGLILGFFIGLKIVAKIKDANYSKIIIGLTFLGALVILLK
jgi:uncharacterized protein